MKDNTLIGLDDWSPKASRMFFNQGTRGVVFQWFFKNGYGASVITIPHSLMDGMESIRRPYEFCVLKGNAKKYELCYDTGVTSDVVPHLDKHNAQELVKQVCMLKKVL